MPILVIATRNAHKVDEIRAVLGPGIEYRTLRDLPGAPTPEETGATFAENARIKSRCIAAWLLTAPTPVPGTWANAGQTSRPAPFPALSSAQTWVLADDSGLEVDALNGAPGIHSARFAAEELGLVGNAPDAANNAKLLRLLAETPAPRRTGRFRCALSITAVREGLATSDFDGTCEGHLGFLPRGTHGFGYDPLFFPRGFAGTFAELGEGEKNAISHRAVALGHLAAWLRG